MGFLYIVVVSIHVVGLLLLLLIHVLIFIIMCRNCSYADDIFSEESVLRPTKRGNFISWMHLLRASRSRFYLPLYLFYGKKEKRVIISSRFNNSEGVVKLSKGSERALKKHFFTFIFTLKKVMMYCTCRFICLRINFSQKRYQSKII